MVRLSESGEDSPLPAAERRHQSFFSAEVHGLNTDAPVVVAQGEVDMATAPELSEAMTEALERNPSKLILDLTEVTFMESSGIKVVVHALNSLPTGCRMVLRRPQPAVRVVFEITDLAHLFAIED